MITTLPKLSMRLPMLSNGGGQQHLVKQHLVNNCNNSLNATSVESKPESKHTNCQTHTHSAHSNNTNPRNTKHKAHSRFSLIDVLFYTLVCCYAIMVAYHSAFGVIDDHTLTIYLLNNMLIPFTHFISVDGGRFLPLDAQELNILSVLFSTSASVFYGFNALCVVLVSFCLSYAIRKVIASYYTLNTSQIKLISYTLVLFLLLCPAFNVAWLRLLVGERMEFVFLSIFVACYMFVATTQSHIWRYAAITIGVLCAQIACFYKETAFILLGCFAFTHLLIRFLVTLQVKRSSLESSAKSPDYNAKSHNPTYSIATIPTTSHPATSRNTLLLVFDVLLLCVCAVWILSYYIIVITKKTTIGRYGDTLHDPVIFFMKNLFTYAMNEPLLFLVIPTLFFMRLGAFILGYKHHRFVFMPLIDSALCASTLFITAYLVLNICDVHYPLPAYIFALFGLGGLTAQILSRTKHNSCCSALCHRFVKGGIIAITALAVMIFLTNSLFYTANTIAHYKGVPQNYQKTLQFLADKAKASQQPLNILLEGVDCTLIEKEEICVSFERWLTHYGVESTRLHIISDSDKYNPLRKDALDSSKSAHSPTLPKDTYIILTPYSSNTIDSSYIAKLDSVYDLVYHADSGWNLGFVGLKAVMKQFFVKNDSNLAFSGNVWNLPVHFYIYKQKP